MSAMVSSSTVVSGGVVVRTSAFSAAVSAVSAAATESVVPLTSFAFAALSASEYAFHESAV